MSKLLLRLAVFVVISLNAWTMDNFDQIKSSEINVSENETITYSLLEKWDEIEAFKEAVYYPFFKKAGFNEEYLKQRLGFLHNLYETKTVKIILLHITNIPIGFITIEQKDDDVLLYTSPILLEPKKIDFVVSEVIKKLYPTVKMVFCLAHKDSEPLKLLLKQLNWTQVKKSPITPNEEYMDSMPFEVFSRKLSN